MTKGKTEKKRYIIPMEMYRSLEEFEFPGTRITGATVKRFMDSKPDKFPDPDYIILEMF